MYVLVKPHAILIQLQTHMLQVDLPLNSGYFIDEVSSTECFKGVLGKSRERNWTEVEGGPDEQWR